MLLTASLDGVAKIWRVSGSGPSVVHGKDLQAGPLFACQSSAEEPALVSFGGSCPVMWNVADEECLEGLRLFIANLKLEGDRQKSCVCDSVVNLLRHLQLSQAVNFWRRRHAHNHAKSLHHA
eukprot:6362232-Amphidinium_carterae.1